MIKFLAKQIIIGIVSLFIFMTILFFILQIIIPGDFATQYQSLALNPSEAQQIGAEVRANLGLNLPLWQQYLHWLWSFISGNLGTSLYGAPVWDILKNLLVASLFIFGLGFLLSFHLGQALAEISFRIRNKAVKGTLSFFAASVYSSFPPWLAFLVILLIAGKTAAINAQTYRTPLIQFDKLLTTSVTTHAYTMLIMFLCLVGFSVLFNFLTRLVSKRIRFHIVKIIPLCLAVAASIGVWSALGIWIEARSVITMAIFPFITFVLIYSGETMLVFRTNMLEVKNENFVLYAKAIGESQASVIRRHIVRNSIFAVLSNAIISLPYIMTGLVIIENATHWTGLGSAVFFAFYNQEMPITMGILFVMGVISLGLRIILEIIQMVLDPRLRRQTDQSMADL